MFSLFVLAVAEGILCRVFVSYDMRLVTIIPSYGSAMNPWLLVLRGRSPELYVGDQFENSGVHRCQRVGRSNRRTQRVVGHFGVDLSSCDAGVAQKPLD